MTKLSDNPYKDFRPSAALMEKIVPYSTRKLEGKEEEFIRELIKHIRPNEASCGTHVCSHMYWIDGRIYELVTEIDGKYVLLQELIKNDWSSLDEETPKVGTSNRDLYR
jgi:hypothetical protein